MDDDLVTLYLHQQVIEEMNLAEKITIRTDASEALDYLKKACFQDGVLLKNACPELILLDVHMPGNDGFELLGGLTHLDPAYMSHYRVILLTTSSHEKDVERAHRFALNGYIVKPLTAKKLSLLLGDLQPAATQTLERKTVVPPDGV